MADDMTMLQTIVRKRGEANWYWDLATTKRQKAWEASNKAVMYSQFVN